MELSIETLDQRLNAFQSRLDRVEEEVLRLAEAHYPDPIGHSLSRERAAILYHEKFFSLLDAGESAVIYSSALSIALCEQLGIGVNLERLSGAPISLGVWAMLAQTATAALAGHQGPDEPLRMAIVGSLRRPNGRPTGPARFLFDELVKLRNDERGHGAALTEGIYEELYRRNEALLHESLNGLEYLRFSFVRVEEVDVAGGVDMRYTLRILAGSASRVERINSPIRIQRGQACVWDGGQTLIDLDGLVRHVQCEECKFEHTFFLDHATTRTTKYHSYAGNHRLSLPALPWAHD